MQTNKVTVTVDVAAELELLDAGLTEVSQLAGVSATWEIIQERGPGGGWPEVDVTFSDRETGKRWLTVFCGGDAEQADEILDM